MLTLVDADYIKMQEYCKLRRNRLARLNRTAVRVGNKEVEANVTRIAFITRANLYPQRPRFRYMKA